MRNHNTFTDVDRSKWPLARNENLSLIGTKYPSYSDIHSLIASKNNINKDFVCLTNGAEEAVRICLSLPNRPNRIQCTPTYGLVDIFNKIYATNLRDIPYFKSDNYFLYDTKIIDKNLYDTDLIYLSNPNSPTGSILTYDYIKHLIIHFKETLFVIDETYIEFMSTKKSVLELVPYHSNLVVIRSFSKYYGLAEARAGFYATSNELLLSVRPANPFSRNTISDIEKVYSIDINEHNNKLIQNKYLLEEYFRETNKIYNSEGNFIVMDRNTELESKLKHIANYFVCDTCLKLTVMEDVNKFIGELNG